MPIITRYPELVFFPHQTDVVSPESCTFFPCLIFEDNFDYLDHRVWEHEITQGGGGVSRIYSKTKVCII